MSVRMERSDIIIILFCVLAVVIGLILVILQKTGKVHPVTTFARGGINYVSGETNTLFGAVLGAVMLYKCSAIAAIGYLILIAGIYIFIQVIFHNR